MKAEFNPPVPTKREVILTLSEEQAITLIEFHGILSDWMIEEFMIPKKNYSSRAIKLHNELYNTLWNLLHE